jgi:hypothetical protein
MHSTHRRTDQTLHVSAKVRPGDGAVDHVDAEILERPREGGRVEFSGVIDVYSAR